MKNPEAQPKYTIIIYWSIEDNCFVAEIPELSGCISHGATEEDALNNIKETQALWIETAKEFDDVILEPKGRLVNA